MMRVFSSLSLRCLALFALAGLALAESPAPSPRPVVRRIPPPAASAPPTTAAPTKPVVPAPRAKSAARTSGPAETLAKRPRPVLQFPPSAVTPAPAPLTPQQMLKRGDGEEEESAEGEVAPKNPFRRAPFATEVGPAAETPWKSRNGGTEGFLPLPGLPLDTSFDSVHWIPQGPGQTKNGDLNIAPNHPTAGCVTSAAPHPTNQNIIYISTVNGGIFKTTNALSNNVRWRPLTDDQLSLSMGWIALDPADATGNTLVAGMGRRSSYGGAGGALRGLLRTTDGGSTWTRLGETALAGRNIYQLTVRGTVILASVLNTDNATAAGLYRSTDTGASFTNMSLVGGSGLPTGFGISHLVADPSNSLRYYCHVSTSGVYRSVDGGATWASISTGLAGASVAHMTLAVAPDGTLFAAECAGTSRVSRSTNQGTNWTQMANVQANTGGLFNGFAADPTNNNLVYLAGLFTRSNFPFSGRVVRGDASQPPASQWTAIASTQGLGTGTAPHTDSRCLVFTAGNRLIECDDGGIYELNIASVGSEGTGAGGGGTWRSLNGDLRNGEMHSLAYDALNRVFIGGAQDTGMQEQLIPGVPQAAQLGWDKTSNGDGGDAAVDLLSSPGNTVRYGSSQNLSGFFRATYNASNGQISRVFPALTLVGGGTPLSGNAPFTAPVTTNAVVGGRLILSGNNNVYESTNSGDTITQIDTVGINPLARIAYGGTSGGVAAPGVLFFASGNAIRFRTAASGPVSGSVTPPAGGFAQGVVLDPVNWRNSWIVCAGAVYSGNDLATNGAAGLTNVTGNLTGVGQFHTIEYLTLPNGHAIVVGTDLGLFLMRLSAPGVWKWVGDNLPRAAVYRAFFHAPTQILTVSVFGRGVFLYDCKPAKGTGVYAENFQAYAEGATVLESTAGEFYSSALGPAARVTDDKQRTLRLTADGTGSTRSALRLPDLNPGQPVTAFSARWNATVTGAQAASLADGFSFNFGNLGAISPANLVNVTYAQEDGFNTGLAVGVRTFSGNAPGYYVRVDGATVPGGFVAKPMADWGEMNATMHFFEVDWRIDTGLTLRVDGVTIFSNLPTPGYVPVAGHRFGFGARTGGFDQETRLDNLAIFTNGVLAPLPAVAPYYRSAEFVGPGQTADKAFDNDPNTKWLAQDYTGFIGASFASAKTVRMYTLTMSEDEPTRDPVSWDFQTSTNGSTWFQHGVQGLQYFATRGERRAFVVANPQTRSAFRLLIHENNAANEIQLSEFQPWELVGVAPLLVVTNTNDSGVGSLRQAIADAAPFANARINFAAGLSGQVVTLASEIVVSAPLNLIIDATPLAAGLTVNGGAGSNRIFTVPAGSTLGLYGLTFAGGNGTGAAQGGVGGAILSNGALTLDGCTFRANNASSSGGALYAAGLTNVTRCTFAGNSAPFGGAISNFGTLSLTHCTISGNAAASNGGGFDNGNGGGIVATIAYSILSGNTANFGPDLHNFNGTVTRVGNSIVRGYAGVAAGGGGTFLTTEPYLSDFDQFGGGTQTFALRPGSAALNAATGSPNTKDQRGFPIVGPPDIGAYEAGTRTTNYNAFIWEILPNTASLAELAPSFDYDGDAQTNLDEFLALTDPTHRGSFFRILAESIAGPNFSLTFPTSVGRTYTIEYTENLTTGPWIPAFTFPGTGTNATELLGPVDASPRFFVRVRASLP